MNNKYNVVFFISSLEGGGAERVTTLLANYWAAKGWIVTIVTIAALDRDFYHLHTKVARVSLGFRGETTGYAVGILSNLKRIFALRSLLRDIKPDVVIAMMTASNILLALSALGMGIPVIGSERIHPPMHSLGGKWEFMRRHIYKALTAVVAQTTESALWLRKHTNAKFVTVIPNPVEWPIQCHEPILPPSLFCKEGKCILLAVGRLDVQKGFDLLINAFANIAYKYPEWDLMILGDGSLRSELISLVSIAGLEGRITLPGRVGNVVQWYEHADLYVMSSRYEGFPNTLAEAMSCGMPAVSFDCDTGPRDIIRHEVDGLLVQHEDMFGLQTALDRLMGDAKLRQQFSMRAVDVRERFATEKVVNMWIKLIDEVSV